VVVVVLAVKVVVEIVSPFWWWFPLLSLPLFLLEFDNFPPEEEESLGGFAGFRVVFMTPPFPPCSFLGE